MLHIHKKKDIKAHQERRHSLLARPTSVFLVGFVMEAALGQSFSNDQFLELPEDLSEDERRIFKEAREHCHYNRDRTDRNLPTVWLPPDQAELTSHSTNFLVESYQTKREVGIAPTAAAVPVGLTMREFFEAAIEAENPLERQASISDDLDFAIRTEVDRRTSMEEWRNETFNKLDHMASDLECH